MLKALKLSALSVATRSGLSAAVAHSRWRQQRLLILCYHGVSLLDEHVWNPDLYMELRTLRRRFDTLRQRGCAVLPLDEAIDRLEAHDLPPRAVTLTFDDGAHDFYARALPLLKEFQFPATVYFSTYYAKFNRPVFDVMCGYLLWKGDGRVLDYAEVFDTAVRLDRGGRHMAERRLKMYAKNMSAPEKDALLSTLAQRLGLDYEELCARRILHLMTMDEAKDCAAAGIAIELHTHRHRAPANHWCFRREIDDNRECLDLIRKAPARHFCYPSGYQRPEFPAWLEQAGIRTATTCHPGMAGPRSHLLHLPRLVDTNRLTATEFDAWVSGVASFLPRRREVVETGVWHDEVVPS